VAARIRGGDGRLVEIGVASNGNIYERVQASPGGAWGEFVQQPGALAA
jgi:hypothetical protein